MNKETSRVLGALLISVLVISLMGIVMAQDPDSGATTSGGSGAEKFGDAISGIVNGIKEGGDPIFKALLGSSQSGEEWVIQILAFLLVVLVVYGILDGTRFIQNRYINFGIGVVVAILGIRFLPPDMLKQLAIPSSAFVAVLTMGLPFILIFFLIKDIPRTGRRAIWIAYGALIFILWIMNVFKSDISTPAKAVYPIIIVACIAAFLFDGTIQNLWRKTRSEARIDSGTRTQMYILEGDIKRLTAALANETDPKAIGRMRSQLEKKNDALKQLTNTLGK